MNPEASDLYISCLYWVITTLTTVGYGDIRGYNSYEQLYTMAVEVWNKISRLKLKIVPWYCFLWFNYGHN
jgi:hypothetical protein